LLVQVGKLQRVASKLLSCDLDWGRFLEGFFYDGNPYRRRICGHLYEVEFEVD
jgi:hypothetical protein